MKCILFAIVGLAPAFFAEASADVPSAGCESFEDVERRLCLKPGPSPMDAPPAVVQMCGAGEEAPKLPADRSISLDGTWQLVEAGCDWATAIPAQVPGSVHLARHEAGAYGDPYFACNDLIAKKDSFRDWCLRRTFTLDAATAALPLKLEFGGVCHACTVILNGRLLGPKHVGMFGGPDYDVTGLVVAGTNTLEVLLERAPYWPPKRKLDGSISNPADNGAWRNTVAFNCCYGWHYAQIPALGIWQSVKLRPIPSVAVEEPFVSTVSTNGTMDFFVVLRGRGEFRGRLEGDVRPANFEGVAQSFSADVAGSGERRVRLRFKIPEPRLWWPNGIGEQNLYLMSLRFTDAGGAVTDGKTFTFGIRTIEMRPTGRDAKPSPDSYNWKLVVNGREVFMKGTGWCTTDALMRFTKERYDRFLGAAKRQNVNFIRAWGCGLVELDYFYDLCDRYGICVMQEWPIAWGSHQNQPAEALEETVVRGVKRLRNRASLFFWCGGNEGKASLEGEVENLNLVGRRTLELDGTRPWHRQEGNGQGSKHVYVSSWGGKNPAAMMTIEAPFLGEFGVDCFPSVESIRRYTPDAEWNELERTKGTEAWRIDPDGAIAHHTPKFNTASDLARQLQHVGMFLPSNSIENVVLGSQIAQAIGVRFTLERARTRFPDCGGAAMYKLNDVYPAASWATVDWYGVEKYASFVVADAFAPLTAIARLERLRSEGKPLDIPLYVVDDADRLAREGSWRVSLRAYDASLREIRRLDVDGRGSVDRLRQLGNLHLSAEEAASVPLWIVVDVTIGDELAGRNFYFVNFEEKQGCLFTSPRTTVEMTREGNVCVFRNTGSLPAVNVHFVCPKSAERFVADDNWFWLEPGETKRVWVNDPGVIERIDWWQDASPGI